jgi:hypothetical protein
LIHWFDFFLSLLSPLLACRYHPKRMELLDKPIDAYFDQGMGGWNLWL